MRGGYLILSEIQRHVFKYVIGDRLFLRLLVLLFPQLLENLIPDSPDFPNRVIGQSAIVLRKSPLNLIQLINLYLILLLILIDLNLQLTLKVLLLDGFYFVQEDVPALGA